MIKLKKEAYILASSSHPNIVKFQEVYDSESEFILVMELVKYGNLKSLLEYRKQCLADGTQDYFSFKEIATIMNNILNAVFHLHSNNIIHRDLKLENILIENKDDLNSVKIADFGLSAYSSTSYQKCGTPLYMAPELYQNKLYNK